MTPPSRPSRDDDAVATLEVISDEAILIVMKGRLGAEHGRRLAAELQAAIVRMGVAVANVALGGRATMVDRAAFDLALRTARTRG